MLEDTRTLKEKQDAELKLSVRLNANHVVQINRKKSENYVK